MKKIGLFSCFILLFASANMHSIAETQKHFEAVQCAKIKVNQQRLLCYDKIFKSEIEAKTSVSTTENGSSLSGKLASDQAQIANKTDSKNENAFGAERIEQIEDNAPDIINARVANMTTNKRNIRTFTLENGQVWRELKSSKLFVKEGGDIYIKRGAFSSYILSTESSSRTSRVTRID